jgi:hypothetical protein
MSTGSADAHYEPPEQFRSIITSTVNKLLRAADPKFDASDGWELLKVKNGVTMHRKKAEKVKGERAIATIRGTGLVRCDAATYVSLAIDLGQRRKTWDTVFLQGKLVEVVDECTSIVWLELRSKKCVMEVHRDVLYMQHTRRLGNNTHVVASRSAGVLQTLIPSPPGAVRATLHTSGYVVRPADDELGTCEVTYVVQFDSGGPIPTALLNRISEDLPQCIARQRIAYADLYGGGGIGPVPVAAAEEEEEDEEVPVSGDMLEDAPPLQPVLLKTQSMSLPLRIGTTRNALSESSDSVYPKSPKSSPRIGMVRQSSAASSPRQSEDETRVSPRVQSAKALPQPPTSPRGSTSPRSNAPDAAARPVVAPRPVSDLSPRSNAPVSPRAVGDTSPRPARPAAGSGALPSPSSPRGARPLPVVPPLATGAIAAEQRNSPVPSPRGSPMPSPRSGGPVPPPPKTAPTPPPRHN